MGIFGRFSKIEILFTNFMNHECTNATNALILWAPATKKYLSSYILGMFDVWFSLTVCPSFFHDSNSRRIHCVRHLLVFSLYHVLAPNFFAILFGRKSLELVCKKSYFTVFVSQPKCLKKVVFVLNSNILTLKLKMARVVNLRLFWQIFQHCGKVVQLHNYCIQLKYEFWHF